MTIRATHVDAARGAAYRERGWWEGTSRFELFRRAAEAGPARVALVDGGTTMTYEQVAGVVDQLAAGLEVVGGVGPGDVVAYQLPNWWETAALLLACAKIGAVVNPLHLVYRADDLGYVLGRTRPKVVLVPGAFGETDHAAVLAGVVDDLDPAPLPVVVRGPVPDGRWRDVGALRVDGPSRTVADADAVSLVLYTSGTTARPKGALHSDNTLVRLVRDMGSTYDLTAEDVVFVPSTMTHVSGLSFVWSALFAGGTAVLLDRWDPERALDEVLRTRCTFVGGATPFVRGLVDAARARGLGPGSVPLRRGNCGSADVPLTLIAEADEVLGAPFSRGYGLTEGIIVSCSPPSDPLDRRGGTDGRVLPVNEVRIVGEDLADLPDGTRGEILVRGPSNFLGYLDPADNDGALVEGSWIRTGDLGVLDDGYLTIAGRIKDIVNRGGENISVKEVEDHLGQHDAVAEVAIVGMPDPVMGERCCAFVVLRPGVGPPTLEDLRRFLAGRGLARPKLPERLEVRRHLPTTSTGKVQKALLRDEVAGLLAGEQRG